MKISGYLHVHSTYSYDGKVSLGDLKKKLITQGVQFVCLTEHTDWLTREKYQAFFQECKDLSDESILFMPGLEVSFPDAHILLVGSRQDVDFSLAPRELVKNGHKQGAFVIFAHPHRSRFQAPEGTEDLLQGIEIWNGQYDGKRVPRPAAWSYRDALAKQEHPLFVTAGVDFHRWSHLPSPHLSVEVEQKTMESLLEALHLGRYALIGPHGSIKSTDSLDSYKGMRRLRIESFVTLQFIRLARWINAVMQRWNIHLPKSALEWIRARI